ncbi:type II secretion system protein [Candidatus Sumerlaeota bacterium]|nr:type II secretion system protein [Candidatus Sumerlaeota bacterium]
MRVQSHTTGTQGTARRGMTLIELIVVVALASILVVGGLKTIATARRIAYLDEVKTELALATQSEMARLRATPWEELPEGESALDSAALGALGFDPDDKTRGTFEVHRTETPDLKEITVRMERQTPLGPARVEMFTWRKKAEER